MGSAESWRGIVADIERSATPRGRSSTGCGWVEGTRLHERALRAGRRVRRAVVSPEFAATTDARRTALLHALRSGGVELGVAPPEALERLTSGRENGIVGLVELPEALPLAQLASPGATVLVAWEVEDPGNVGALARTALAAGAAGFVTVGISDPFHPRAIRTSRGSVFKLPWSALSPRDGATSLAAFETVAAITRGGDDPHRLPSVGRARALVVGGEAFGLPQAVAAALDRRVSIPMSDAADSFSVNAAAAILLWALRSSRGGGP